MRKHVTFILLSIFITGSLHSQTIASDEVKFMSYGRTLAVTNNGDLVVASRIGEVAVFDPGNNSWEMRSPGKKNTSTFSTDLLADDAVFFNKDTGFLAGFIQGTTNKHDIIYHTSDGGKNWTPVNFGSDGWVDAVSFLEDGQAWLSVGGAGIAYTKDYGFTWKSYEVPDKRHRYTSIFLNGSLQGIIGSQWDLLAVSSNNGESWTPLPTPLNQKKYNKTNRESRPCIDKVAIFGNYYLVSQEGLVFYSAMDSISWTWLPAYKNFITDPENSALFFESKKQELIRADQHLQPISTIDTLIQSPDAICKNGILFVMDMEGITRIKGTGEINRSMFVKAKQLTQNPKFIAYRNWGTYGIVENRIYLQSAQSAKWEFAFKLPFQVDDGHVLLPDDQSLVYVHKDTLTYYNLATQVVTHTTYPAMIEKFLSKKIAKISFEQGSSGCFHHYRDELIFTNEHGSFEPGSMRKTGSQHPSMMPDGGESMPENVVINFLKAIIEQPDKPMSVADLGFTENDFEQCKKDIRQFGDLLSATSKRKKKSRFQFGENNVDVAKLLSLVDTVKLLPSDHLLAGLKGEFQFFSTTTNSLAVIFENTIGEKFTISSTYYKPGLFYFPWRISLNGLERASPDIRVNRFIESAYPGFLKETSKVEALHALVKNLYRDKVANEGGTVVTNQQAAIIGR